jgi:hypothetical protein
MRTTLIAVAVAASIGSISSQPASAWDDSNPTGNVYVHHHYYAPYRYWRLNHLHVGGPRHVHVVHYPCGYDRHGGCFAPWGYRYKHFRWFW